MSAGLRASTDHRCAALSPSRPRETGCVKSPSFNLRVERLSQFHAYGKPIPLVTSARGWQLRKQFCASLAHATFHTAWKAATHAAESIGRSRAVDDLRSNKVLWL